MEDFEKLMNEHTYSMNKGWIAALELLVEHVETNEMENAAQIKGTIHSMLDMAKERLCVG